MATVAVPYFMGEPMSGFEVPGPHDTIAPPLPDGSPQARMAVLYRALADWVAAHEHPVVYAGDCVSALGVLAGLQRTGLDPQLVWFDAHGDFHTWETTQSGFIGGMPLAMAVGRGEQTIVTGTGLRPIPEGDAVLVDARDLDPGEDEAVAASGLTVLSVEEFRHWDPGPRPVHLHVDVDVVDPADLPAVNYPAQDGPGLAEVRAAMIHAAAADDIVAFSVSAWNPALPGAGRAAAATARLAAPFLAS